MPISNGNKIVSVLNSTDNSLFATINGIKSNTVDIINSTSIDLDGVSLSTSTNGVVSNTVPVQPLIPSPTANNFVWVDGTGKVIDSSLEFVTTLGLDHTSVPSSLAVVNSIAYAVASGKSYRGGYDASSNLFPSTGGSGTSGEILAGDQWGIIVAGTLGTVPVVYGDSIVAIFDSPGQTQSNWILRIDKVDTVFGRAGTVVAETGDYNINQITNGLSNIATSAQMLVANGSNILTPLTMSGDVTNNNTGVQTIGANKVTNAKLAQAIARTYKGNNTDGTANILDVAMGNITEVTSNVLTINGGTNSVLNSLTIAVKQATASVSGYLTTTDWNTFNNKQPLLSPTNRLDATNVGTGVINNTIFNYLQNVTSDIQAQLNTATLWTLIGGLLTPITSAGLDLSRTDDQSSIIEMGNPVNAVNTYIDFKSPTWPDFVYRQILDPSGNVTLIMRGTGKFLIQLQEAATFAIGTNNVERISIAGTGETTFLYPVIAPNVVMQLSLITSTVSTTTLTNTSKQVQVITGTLTQDIKLPVSTTLQPGWQYEIINNTTTYIRVKDSGNNMLYIIQAGASITLRLSTTDPTTLGTWLVKYTDASYIGTGNVSNTIFGYLSNVTSDIQTQINTKQTTITGGATTIASSNLTASKALISDGSGKVAVSSTTSTELGYVTGVTSSIQTQINTKQTTITGGATTIASSNLTVSRALISDGSGKVAVSSTTSIELGYVAGVTSSIQAQINAIPANPWSYSSGLTTLVNQSNVTIGRTDISSAVLRIGNSSTQVYSRIDFYDTFFNDYCDRFGRQVDQTFLIEHRGTMPLKFNCPDGGDIEFHSDFASFGGTTDEGVIGGGYASFSIMNDKTGYRTVHVLNTATSPTSATAIVASKGTSDHNLVNLQFLNLASVPTSQWYAQCSTSAGTAGGIRANGAGVSFPTTSDMRIKNSIVKMEDAYYYNLIQKNTHQTYEFKYNGSDTVQYGFIAQNIREVFPHLVMGEDEDLEKTGDPLQIDYSQVVPVLYSALKDAITEIENLKLEIANIKTKLK